jgi:glycosyltransferase involved in cell wall biosynthesis
VNVLHIAAQMNYSGANKELAALAIDQRSQGHNVRVCCLGRRGPWTARLHAAGIVVETLEWTRWFDLAPLGHLRDLLRHADVEAIQIWGPAALRCVGLFRPKLLRRAIYSPPLPHARQLSERWLLGRVGHVVIRDETEKSRAVALGVHPDRAVIVPPGLSEIINPFPASGETTQIVGLGPLEKTKNFRDAIWTMDILNEVFPDLELTLVGQGSQRESLALFAARFQKARLHLAGECDDMPTQLAKAALCWLPALGGCRHAALESLAAGRPIVASDLPHLRDLISDGETGFLVPAGDKIALARKTRTLVLDPALRQRMGEAGQRHVRARFPQHVFLQRWRDVLRAA